MPDAERDNARKKFVSQLSWRRRGIIFGGWTLFGVFIASQLYLNSAPYYGQPIPFGRALTILLIYAYVWALLTPSVIRLARRFPIERGQYLRSTALHLFASVLFSSLQLALYIFARQWLLGDRPRPFSPLHTFQHVLVAEFHRGFQLYWSVLGLCHAYNYYRRYRERERRAAQLELEASQLETQLARAQLDALRTQLHPHFLFNTLNTISVLMREDVATADRMLLRLSELLRLALKNTGAHEVSLRQEMEFLRCYLEIEQTRFQNRLKVKVNVDAEVLDARVPNLILQPLVENAVRHGVAPRPTEGTVEIRARRRNGQVELQVRDDGPGIDDMRKETAATGIGLSNTRARLDKLYGAAHSFHLSSADGGGTRVTIMIPFHPADGNEESSSGEDQGVDR